MGVCAEEMHSAKCIVQNENQSRERAFIMHYALIPPMRITLQNKADLSDADLSALSILNAVVYPPDALASWPGRTIEWAKRQWSVMVWSDDGSRVLAHAGVLIREARHNDREVRVGGIGGVMTHPEFRKQGYATAAVARCVEFFREQGDIDFGLLVCVKPLLPFYASLGWQPFSGTFLVTQAGQTVPFTFNDPMTYPIKQSGELTGTIDLQGPPW